MDHLLTVCSHFMGKRFNPLNPGSFYEFRKFIKISPVGITKWNHFIQEESHLKTDGKTYKYHFP
jgi:hypothetical protein